ncbi:hypothetical protein ACSSS7_006642 [Eimeria intestinalis]
MSLHARSSTNLSLGPCSDSLVSPQIEASEPLCQPRGRERKTACISIPPAPELQQQTSAVCPAAAAAPVSSSFQQQQQMQRHIIKPSLFAANQQHEQLYSIQQQQPARIKAAPPEAAASNRRSHSNSSLPSVEKKRFSPSDMRNIRSSSSRCCTKGSGCTCTSEARNRFVSLEGSRMSFASTRSSTGPQILGTRRYSSSDTDFNSSSAVAAAAGGPPTLGGGPSPLALPSSPSLAAGVASASFSVGGGEGCSEWGAILSPDEAGSSNNSRNSSSSSSSGGSLLYL